MTGKQQRLVPTPEIQRATLKVAECAEVEQNAWASAYAGTGSYADWEALYYVMLEAYSYLRNLWLREYPQLAGGGTL